MHVHPQRALGGFRRVLLAERAGGGVAGVGQRRLAGLDQGLVEFGEGLRGNEDLAADLHLGREVVAGQLLRDFLDGQDVVGDVLAGVAVPAGGGPDQFAVAVEEVDRQAVDLEFREPGGTGAAVAQLGDACLGLGDPGLEFLEGKDVLEAVHPLQMFDGGKGGGHFAAHLLGGRIVGHQFGVHCFDRFEAPEEFVELGVRNGRRVLLVVGKAVFADLFHQVLVFLAHGAGGHPFPCALA